MLKTSPISSTSYNKQIWSTTTSNLEGSSYYSLDFNDPVYTVSKTIGSKLVYVYFSSLLDDAWVFYTSSWSNYMLQWGVLGYTTYDFLTSCVIVMIAIRPPIPAALSSQVTGSPPQMIAMTIGCSARASSFNIAPVASTTKMLLSLVASSDPLDFPYFTERITNA